MISRESFRRENHVKFTNIFHLSMNLSFCLEKESQMKSFVVLFFLLRLLKTYFVQKFHSKPQRWILTNYKHKFIANNLSSCIHGNWFWSSNDNDIKKNIRNKFSGHSKKLSFSYGNIGINLSLVAFLGKKVLPKLK